MQSSNLPDRSKEAKVEGMAAKDGGSARLAPKV